jgi:hypothetical protein
MDRMWQRFRRSFHGRHRSALTLTLTLTAARLENCIFLTDYVSLTIFNRFQRLTAIFHVSSTGTTPSTKPGIALSSLQGSVVTVATDNDARAVAEFPYNHSHDNGQPHNHSQFFAVSYLPKATGVEEAIVVVCALDGTALLIDACGNELWYSAGLLTQGDQGCHPPPLA